MFTIKKKISDIVKNRYRQKCYLIYDDEGDFFVIYGTRWRTVEGGDLYDILMSFLESKKSWEFTERRIIRNRNNGETWKDLNNDMNEKIIDIDVLYIDGIKEDLNKTLN
ncbi:hypothetical protein ABES21_24280 [Peribacillus frigoritolerans]|uniref:hypothetical protein n=1 Tax=Peribacillus frigoritolerans TaxID=450367 RepID=UPI003D276DB4